GRCTVSYAGGIARRDASGLGKHRRQLGHLFQRRPEEGMFILLHDLSALFGFNCDRSDFFFEFAARDGLFRALLRPERKLVLLFAADLVLSSQNLSRLTNDQLAQWTGKSTAIHAVDEFLIAEPIAPAPAIQIIRNA